MWYVVRTDFCLINSTREHPEISCVRSDKGGKTVLMLKDDYIEKATTMMNDRSTYLPISDPTSGTQTLNNDLVKGWFKKGLIDYGTKRKLTTYTAVPPRMYFLPKCHKTGLPLRPIRNKWSNQQIIETRSGNFEWTKKIKIPYSQLIRIS